MGAGLTLGASGFCLAAPGIAFCPRLRRSPHGEGKRGMEEFKDFCSGGRVDARSIPGVNLRCLELRDFGPFAKQEQPPAEPRGSGGFAGGPVARELLARTGHTGNSV